MNRGVITTKRRTWIDFVTTTFEPVRRLWKHGGQERTKDCPDSTPFTGTRMLWLSLVKEKKKRKKPTKYFCREGNNPVSLRDLIVRFYFRLLILSFIISLLFVSIIFSTCLEIYRVIKSWNRGIINARSLRKSRILFFFFSNYLSLLKKGRKKKKRIILNFHASLFYEHNRYAMRDRQLLWQVIATI